MAPQYGRTGAERGRGESGAGLPSLVSLPPALVEDIGLSQALVTRNLQVQSDLPSVFIYFFVSKIY